MAEYQYLGNIGITQLITLTKQMGAKKLEIEKVNTLPSSPNKNTIYLIEEGVDNGVKISKAYIYINEWICIGNTNNKTQITTMPAANAENKGKVYQYIGADTQDYTHNYFYECVEDTSTLPSTYSWVNVNVQESGTADDNYDIVADSSLLPMHFTATDRKLYFSIADGFFWLWDGEKWAEQQPKSISKEYIDSLFD